MITINLWDSNFPGQSCSVAGQESTRVRYVRDQLDWDGITVFTDGQMFSPAVDAVRSPIKIGWLQEPKPLHPENYARSWDVRHKFDAILTYDQELLAADPDVYRFTIRGGVWVPREQWSIYPKMKQVSMILSEKRSIASHQLRHAIAEQVPGIDLFGPEYTPIGYDKALAYRDYRYAVVVDTTNEPNYFSEHLLDALAFGCVVLYCGCPNIGDFLDDNAILSFQGVEDLTLLLGLTAKTYPRQRPALRNNLALLPEYMVTEDWQAEHIYASMLAEVPA